MLRKVLSVCKSGVSRLCQFWKGGESCRYTSGIVSHKTAEFKFINYKLAQQLLRWKLIACLLVALFGLKFCILNKSSQDSSIRGFSGGKYIAKVVLEGEIMSDPVREERLEALLKDKNIAAVILEINSPGGTVTASEILYDQIRQIALVKPTVSVIKDVGASGAYMAAIGTDYIIARNTSIVGSIGVLLQAMDFTEISKKVGVGMKTYRSSDFKAAPNAFEKDSEKVREYIQSMIMDGYDFFAQTVAQRRGIKDQAQLQSIANGKVFSGRQAVKLKLIDEIGDQKSALAYFEKKHKIKGFEVEEYMIREEEQEFGVFDLLLDKMFKKKREASTMRLMAVL